MIIIQLIVFFFVIFFISLEVIIIGYLKYYNFLNSNIFYNLKLNFKIWEKLIDNPLMVLSLDNWVFLLAILIGLIFSLLLTYFIYPALKRQKQTKKRSLTSSEAIKSLLKKGVSKETGIFAGRYKRKEFFVSYEDRGIAIGPPSRGKTVYLKNQLLKTAENRISFIVLDIKPEIYGELKDELKLKGYKVLGIDPFDKNSTHYNILDDCSEDQIFDIVRNLLPITEKEPPWVEAEREYLRLALFYLKKINYCSLSSVYQFFLNHKSAESFLSEIENCTDEKISKQASQIKSRLSISKPIENGFGAVCSKLNEMLFFENMREVFSYSDFSLSALGQEEPVALFLLFKETKLSAMGSLLSAFCGHCFNFLIENHEKRKPVALFFDEVGNIPVISELLEKLNTIRSRMMPTWLYFQDVEQMVKYQQQNQDVKQVFLSCADLQIFFGQNSKESREIITQLIGTTTEKKITETKTKGQNSNSKSKSTSEKLVNVIEPYEVGKLKQGQIITLYKGEAAIGEATPYYIDYPKFKKR